MTIDQRTKGGCAFESTRYKVTRGALQIAGWPVPRRWILWNTAGRPGRRPQIDTPVRRLVDWDQGLSNRFLLLTKGLGAGAVVALLGLVALSCAVRHVTRVEASKLPPPPQEASTRDLAARVNAWSEGIRTLVATVNLEPTAGSVYSGVIKQYNDVKGFILFEKPALIRMVGQAPIIQTQIFDMASDGKEFRVYVAPKEKFIVGNTASTQPAKNSLENLRPQHIVEALLVPPLDPARENYFREEGEDNGRRWYVLTVLEPGADRELSLKRKVWFDRADLAITQLQVYGPQGAYREDVRYGHYQDFEGVRYPTQIQIRRPIEDYRLTISILKATFNQPIAPEKFELEKPKSAELVDLTAASPGEEPHGQ